MSLRNLKNNETQGTNSSNNIKSELIPARVFSIILDNTHPKYTGEDSVGTIFYGKVNLNESSVNLDTLNRARPLFSFIKYYPLINEIVLILNTTSRNIYSDIGGDNAFISTYYLPNINVWNNPQHNALPLERNLKSTPNSQEAALGIQQNNVEKNNIELGEYFKEKDSIKSVQPFEGDMILEGRFGNSIRFGSSNPKGKNNWSENSSEGDPIVIIANGQPQVTGDTILEDINSIDSSIFMLSNQNINNFIPASLNLQSLGTQIAPTPNRQILIEDTPNPPIAPQPEPIITETPEPVIEETPITESPPVIENITPPSEIDDPIFALLDEAQDEGELTFIESIYGFGEIESNYRAAAPPDLDPLLDPDENSATSNPISNEAEYRNTLPLSQTPSKVRYTPVYLEPLRKWTTISNTRLASIIKSFNIPNSLKYSVMFIALKEQTTSPSTIGGFNNNHYGIMTDLGRWRFGQGRINGSIPSTEGAGGQGIRTDQIRYFASFADTNIGVDFMAKTLEGKDFNTASSDNIVDLYVDKWLSPSPSVATQIKRDKRTSYSKLFNKAKNLIDNAV